MNYNKIWNIGLNTLSGAAIFFVLLMIPPYLTAFTNETNDVLPELKAQEINPWIDEPIPELNDLTLRQVFENGLTVGDFTMTTTIGRNFTPILEETYSTYYLITNTNIDLVYFSINTIVYNEQDIFEEYILLEKNQINSNRIITGRIRYRLNLVDEIKEITIQVSYIDLVALGLDNLTLEQMDNYYSRYLRYKDSTINDYTTVFNNYLSLAPDSNPLEIVKPIEYYMNIILDTYDTISNFWNNVSNLFVVDVLQENAFEIYDKWWFKPFQWLIGE